MESMSNYIFSVLKSSPAVFMSWGSCCFKSINNDNGLSFRVNGFLYQGDVSIVYNGSTDAFDVTIGGTTHDTIFIDTLVEVIDSHVENNGSPEEYGKKIDQWMTEFIDE